MKTIALFISTFFLIASLFAQAPQSFHYQAVARDNSGNVLANQPVSFRISILSGSIWGATVYCETHTGLSTNTFGLAELEIGKGTPLTGTFSAINWGSNSYYVKIELDPAGGSLYQVLSISQMLSVPYALYAQNAGNGFSGDYNDLTNKPLLFDGTWNNLTGKPTTLAGYGITDAMNTSHVANGITSTLIDNWNSAYGWGNHAGLYKPLSYLPLWSEITAIPAGFTDGVDNVDDADNSTTNEIQVLSITGNNLSLSKDGGNVTIPGDNWGNQAVFPDATLTGDGTKTKPLSLADNAVTSAKIADGAITAADIGASAVTSVKIADGTVAAADIASNAITTVKIANSAITDEKIASGAVTGAKIAQAGATSGQVLKWSGTTWAPDADETGVLQWQNSGADIYFNTGKVGIGKIPGADLKQFQVLTANNQAIAAVNNSTGYAAIYAQNQGIGPAAEFRNFIKIADGTEGEGKILTSNAIGTASWKPLAVVTDATLTGSGTTASPLKIAQMGASTGHVLKWTGATWDNAADNTGPWTESDLYIYNTSAKKFGIGTSSPSRKVTIAESGTEAYLNIHNSSTGYTISDGILIGMQGVNGWLTTYEDGVLNIGTNNTMKMIIEAGGDVGIGTTNPGYKLQVGNYSDGTQARANAWNIFSDVNLKRDLTRLTNPLAMVEKLTGYYFFWNTGIDQSRQIGFSAQEVNEVLPEVVSKGEDGYLSMEYSKITPLLVEAIKQLKAENDRLKSENEAINSRLEKIEALIGNSAEKY